MGMLILSLTGTRALDEAEKIRNRNYRARENHSPTSGKGFEYSEFEKVAANPPAEMKYHPTSYKAAEYCILPRLKAINYYILTRQDFLGQYEKICELKWISDDGNYWALQDYILTPMYFFFHGLGVCAAVLEHKRKFGQQPSTWMVSCINFIICVS